MRDPKDDEERVGFDGSFEENLSTLLGVDPEAVEDGVEEPEQDA